MTSPSTNGSFSDGFSHQGGSQESPFQGTDRYMLLLWVDRHLGSQEKAFRNYAQRFLKWPKTEFLQHMERMLSEQENSRSKQRVVEILQNAASHLPSILELKDSLLDIYEKIPSQKRTSP